MTNQERAHEYIVMYTITTFKYQFVTKAKDRGFPEPEAEVVWEVIDEMRDA